MNAAIVLKLLDIMLLGMTLAPEAASAAQLLADKLRGFEGRDPTPEEWAVIDAETDALMAGLRTRADEARAERGGGPG